MQCTKLINVEKNNINKLIRSVYNLCIQLICV